jgi:predicted methyltransferase
MRIAIALVAGLLATASLATISHAQTPSAAVTAAVADAGRTDAEKARDAGRKPAMVVAVSGVKPGDKVGELAPGGGYYSKILAKTVGANGKVYAFNNRPASPAYTALLAANPNVTLVAITSYPELKAPEPLDVVWTTENYHDFKNNGGDTNAVNKAVFAALKPGGTYFITDHNAPGTGVSATSTLHRIDVEAVKAEVLAAGFTLETQSNVLANPADTHATSPGAEPGDFSDRFVLKFRKPR